MAICGTDVSHHNVIDDWDRLAEAVGFVLIKASQYRTDPMTNQHATKARERSLTVGFYHYLVMDRDGARQAQLYLDSVDDLATALPAIVDVEGGGNAGATVDETIACLTDFLDELAVTDSRRPIIYTSRRDWDLMTGAETSFAGRADLWLARFSSSPGTRLPAGWDRWLFWQHSATGYLPGSAGRIDMDIFDGHPADLASLIDPGLTLTWPVPSSAEIISLNDAEPVLFQVQPEVAASDGTLQARLIGRRLDTIEEVLFGTQPATNVIPILDSGGTALLATVPSGTGVMVDVTAVSAG